VAYFQYDVAALARANDDRGRDASDRRQSVGVRAGLAPASNFKNSGGVPLRLYTVYAPPEHPDGTVHRTKEEADADEHDH
jgi:hypothetical protein